MRVVWTRRALKSLEASDAADQIVRATERYAENGLGDVKRLKGQFEGQSRLSTGRWRVRFIRERDLLTVTDVDDRGKAYRRR